MKKHERLITLILLLCIFPLISYAQWSTDVNENTLVTNAVKDQREPMVISDGSGGVIIAWRDYQYNESIFGGDILSQRLDDEGYLMWQTGAIEVNTGSLGKGHFSPVAVEDGYGGAVMAWARTPGFFYNYDIFAQKLKSDGTRLWAANDVTISDKPGTESFHQIVSDDSCGAILTWTHLPGTPGSTDIYAQRVDSSGNTRWVSDGVEICMAAESQSNPTLTSDGSSGAIVTWGDSRRGIGESDIYAQRISHEGVVQWAADGVRLCSNNNFQTFPVIIGDGAGGAIIAWADSRAGNFDIYAQRINAFGDLMWTEQGIPVCSASQDQDMPQIVGDGAGGAFVVWQDQRNGDMDIFAQRLNGSGEMLWANDGVSVTIAPNNQHDHKIVSDNVGGVLITWTDHRSDPLGDIYAQRIDASGNRLWNDNGSIVCGVAGYQETPVLSSDGDEGAIIVWADKRNGTDYDIYAQKMDKKGDPGVFIDSDLDGIGDQEEQGSIGNDPDYDGNNDGTADRLQANVASFKTFSQEQYVSLAVPEPLVLEDVQAIDNPDPDAPGSPEADGDPYGFFSFTISGLSPGGSTVAKLILHGGPEISTYYKYGPTPTESNAWYEFTYDGETGALINEDTVFLHLSDGLRGDYDISANGIIVEPGGPIYLATSIIDYSATRFELEPVFPNPVSDIVTIPFSVAATAEIKLEVYDLSGRLIKGLFKGILPEGEYQKTWDFRNFNEGTYILKMSDGKGSVTRKVIKLSHN